MKTSFKFNQVINDAGQLAPTEGHTDQSSSPRVSPCGLLSIKKHYQGCYRISDERNVEDPFSVFGQIYKDGRKWIAEIRYSESGDIKRYAGIWDTKKDAIEEVVFIISR